MYCRHYTIEKSFLQGHKNGKKILDKRGRVCYDRHELAEANYDFRVMVMTLLQAQPGTEYIIERIETDDEELNSFLFTLGCYSGEPITVVAHRKTGTVVSIKDGRYTIDEQLAQAIVVVG